MPTLDEVAEDRYREIIEYLKNLNHERKKCAVWGAGKLGRNFCQRVDKDGRLISYMFDKDESKYGKKLPTGQKIVDYRQYCDDIDVIFIVMSSFKLDTVERLKGADCHAKIVDVTSWVYGGVTAEEQFHAKSVGLEKIRNVNIGALVIAYNPSRDVLAHIPSYADDVEKIYVWDNSKESHEELFNDSEYSEKIKYISEGINKGLGYPINVIADKAYEDGINWLVTFDQDSRAGKDMIKRMRDYVESNVIKADIAMVMPHVYEPTNKSDKSGMDGSYNMCSDALDITYIRQGIQSGAMHRLDALREVHYRAELFIDCVDFDYCERLRIAGYRIAQLNNAMLLHQEDAGAFDVMECEGYRFYIGKYSPARYYYQYRNMLYGIKWFSGIDDEYVKGFKEGIKKINVMIKHDRNISANKKAIKCASRDFGNGVLGEWNGK